MLVIKIGGAAGVDYQALCADLAAVAAGGEQVVLVHGGSAETDALAERLGRPARFITSPSGNVSRSTDRETLEIYAMATARLNRLLVERLRGAGVNAFGLSGIDGGLLRARRHTAIRSVESGRVRIVRDDWSGRVQSADGGLLRLLLDNGYLPVIAPLALGEGGEMLNIDGDLAAAAVAGAVEANALLLLTNVAGLLQSFPDESSLIQRIDRDHMAAATELAQGRMKKKLLGAAEALQHNVSTVIIGDGRRPTPIRDALAGAGTHIS